MGTFTHDRQIPFRCNYGRSIACLAVSVSCASGALAADRPARAPRGMEEVIVTAQKRAENLQEVPISVSVLTGAGLDRSTDRGVVEALNRVPGVASAISNAGARNNLVTGVVVRGVAPNGGALTGSSTTGYYLDSIPFGFIRQSYAPDSNAYDLERVEVLRGPQGTLYGVSALNGVVRVLTRDANLNDFELKGRASGSSTRDGGENYRGDVAINVPIVEGKLAVRAVVGYQDMSGWIDKTFQRDANDSQLENYRLKVNAQPTEQFSLGLLAWASRSDFGAPSNSGDGRTSLSPFEEPASTDYDAYSLKLGYDFSWATLTSSTSYLDYVSDGTYDFNPFNNSQFFLNATNESEIFSEEVLLSSRGDGPVHWSLGGIYRDADERFTQTRTDRITGALCCTYLSPTIQGTVSESFAAFGEVTWALLDGRLELTGGLRYFEDRIDDHEFSRLSAAGGVPATGLINASNKFDSVSPRAVITWHPSDATTLYASYAEGFRSGLNQLPSVAAIAPEFGAADPDELESYEIGAKGDLWGGVASIDAAVFFIDWTGVQQAIPTLIRPGASPIISSALVNANSASGIGAEFGASVRPIDGLVLGVNFSWNELEVDEDVFAATGALVFPKGTRLALSPEYTIGGSIDYATPLGGSGYEGRFSTSANYRPEIIAARTTGTTTFPAESQLIVRATLAIQSPHRWTASVFVDNLTNDDGLSIDPFSLRWNTYVRPRTIGAQVEYAF